MHHIFICIYYFWYIGVEKTYEAPSITFLSFLSEESRNNIFIDINEKSKYTEISQTYQSKCLNSSKERTYLKILSCIENSNLNSCWKFQVLTDIDFIFYQEPPSKLKIEAVLLFQKVKIIYYVNTHKNKNNISL